MNLREWGNTCRYDSDRIDEGLTKTGGLKKLKCQKVSNPDKAGEVSIQCSRGSLPRRGEAAVFSSSSSSPSTTGTSDGQPHKNFCRLKSQQGGRHGGDDHPRRDPRGQMVGGRSIRVS